jgi:hypothetical protein
MRPCRPKRNSQSLGDFFTAGPFGDESKDLSLPGRKLLLYQYQLPSLFREWRANAYGRSVGELLLLYHSSHISRLFAVA